MNHSNSSAATARHRRYFPWPLPRHFPLKIPFIALLHILLCCVLLAPFAFAQQDLLYGTWQLKPGLSVYTNQDQDPPRSQTRIYKPHPEGIECIIITVSADGIESQSSYIAALDGAPHPVYGLPNSDSVMLERRNRYTSSATFLHAGIAIGTAERTISPSGNEMTITLTLGGEVFSKSIYGRVEDEASGGPGN